MSRLLALVLLGACNPSTSPPVTPPPAPPAAAPAAAPTTPPAAADLVTDQDMTLYALGRTVGRSLAPFQLTPDELAKVEAGLDDFATGKPGKVDEMAYQEKIQALAEGRASIAGKANEGKSKAFLDQLAAAPGATVTPSGIVYLDLTVGKGAQPKATDVVQVNYRGTLADGYEFDSSYARGEPATFSLGEVVPCWSEGIQKMKVGGKAKLGCPSKLAYGDQGSGDIPPGSALLFEVELLGIEKQ